MGSAGRCPFEASGADIVASQKLQSRSTRQGIGRPQPTLDARRASILESDAIVMNETAGRMGRN